MIHDANLSPVVSFPEDISSGAAYRRGRNLTWIMMVVTTAFFIQDEVKILWWHGFHGVTGDRMLGWLIDGWVCWSVLHGGRFARGWVSFLYGVIFLCVLIVAASVAANWFYPRHESLAPGFGQSWQGTFPFVALCLWTTFSLWVLLISKDARLYMKARRLDVTAAEANAFEWPPRRR